MSTNLRGEMKSIQTGSPPSSIHIAIIDRLADAMRISSSEVTLSYELTNNSKLKIFLLLKIV